MIFVHVHPECDEKLMRAAAALEIVTDGKIKYLTSDRVTSEDALNLLSQPHSGVIIIVEDEKRGSEQALIEGLESLGINVYVTSPEEDKDSRDGLLELGDQDGAILAEVAEQVKALAEVGRLLDELFTSV